MLAATHANSFLDAILIGVCFPKPIHFLARGDVFKQKWALPMCRLLNMQPIYRALEGKEFLNLNTKTFAFGVDRFKQGDSILIFVEGYCRNQTELILPLKKGGPRILLNAWQENIQVEMLPVWIHYSNFRKFGKEIRIAIGTGIGNTWGDIVNPQKAALQINQQCSDQLLGLQKVAEANAKNRNLKWQMVLWPFGVVGAVIHYPLILIARVIVKILGRNRVHHDSLLFSILLFLYPFYLAAILYFCFVSNLPLWSWLIIFFPAMAKCFTISKPFTKELL